MPAAEDKDKKRSAKAPRRPDNDAFLKWLESVPDPVERYALATSELEKYQETVRSLSSLRAEALADASKTESLSSVARRLGVSRQRAHQLVNDPKRTGTPKPKKATEGGARKAPQKREEED